MPKPKDPDEGRGEKERREERERPERVERGHHEHGKRDDDDKERPRRRRMGREHAVHQELLEQRIGGGDAPTPEAYAKALEEWQQLPGSIVHPPTDVKPSEKDTTKVKDEKKKEE